MDRIKWLKLIAEHKKNGKQYSDLSKAEKVELSKLQAPDATAYEKRQAARGKKSGVGQALGEESGKFIDAILEELLDEWQTGASLEDKKTGEISIQWAKKAAALRPEMKQHYLQRLSDYAKHAAIYRRNNNMRKFEWKNETVDRVRDYVKKAKWQYPKIRTGESKKPVDDAPPQLTPEQIKTNSIWYSDEQHCLALSTSKELTPDKNGLKPKSGQAISQRFQLPEYQVERGAPRSPQALDAIHQFETTGKVSLDNSLSKRNKESYLKHTETLGFKWSPKSDSNDGYQQSTTHPIREAEPLSALIAEVAEKYYYKFERE